MVYLTFFQVENMRHNIALWMEKYEYTSKILSCTDRKTDAYLRDQKLLWNYHTKIKETIAN
ncbi:MAG: hypothetical protein LBS55_03590 [Prevotellaceae bacterium]|nr:hypothetical protein [Prevotellaceae bacterium]